MVEFGASDAGHGQSELAVSVGHQQYLAKLFAVFMVAEAQVPAVRRAEPAVRLRGPFTGSKLAKRDGNCLKAWLNCGLWKTLPV